MTGQPDRQPAAAGTQPLLQARGLRAGYAGVPVLHGVQGESAGIVEREDVGLTFEPQNVDALCDALRRIATDDALHERLRENGPRAARGYDRTELAASMLSVLERTAHRSGPPAIGRAGTATSRAPGR